MAATFTLQHPLDANLLEEIIDSLLDGVQIGTASASRALITDSNNSITGLTNIGFNGFLNESVTTGITAGTTRTQAGATALTTEINRVDTSTAPSAGTTLGDGVLLPATGAFGRDVIVVNNTSNLIQVYGKGSDTINGVASGTGVFQPANSVGMYITVAAGAWYCADVGLGYSGNLQTTSAVNGLTAHAGGGQGSATVLPAMMNRVTTVASGNDSVVLPASVSGMQIVVANAAASNSLNVFPASGETIDALSANAARAVAANKTATFYCFNAGQWHSLLTA